MFAQPGSYILWILNLHIKPLVEYCFSYKAVKSVTFFQGTQDLPEVISDLYKLKGPKREIIVDGIFTEIRPVWVGDLETRPKNLKNLCLWPYITLYFLEFFL
jgi:hypothetical protein